MNLFEVLVYWFWVSLFGEDFSEIVVNNLQLIVPYRTYQIFWDTMFYYLLLFPMSMIWFLHFYLKMNRKWQRLILTSIYTLILASMPIIMELAGYVYIVNWKFWWSIVIWLTFIISTVGLMYIIRWLKGRDKQPV
ncbi:hypothetical protein [Paenibacillus andongensis]|uniref:hypothetical protein n=1 Tax=Paenibacillus andongensis TaxID=2975482 RepID=UPI0021BB210F|nr:hypothetical protein [Paenibacillus andongensis]